MTDPLFSRRTVLKAAVASGVAALIRPIPGMAEAAEPPRTPGLERVVRELGEEIRRVLIDGQIPSMTVALVAGDEVVWSGGYGHSNVWARTPAVSSTIYFVGSIYKTVNAAAVMQMVERGNLGLDDPVRDYLPFPIQGETAARPVRVRHLLAHVSGFGSNPPGIHHDVWGDTTPPPLEEYLREHARVERPPEEELVYSNLAFTVAGYLVERVSGVPFRDYVHGHIFDPLEMTDTAYVPTPQMRERLALPYALDDEDRLVSARQFKSNHYPAGVVWAPVGELARWLAVNLNGGAIDGIRVLSEESVAEMHRAQFPKFRGQWRARVGEPERTAFGLAWVTGERGGDRLIAHSGSLPGYTSFVAGNLTRRTGVALMSNRIRTHDYLAPLAEKALRLMGEHLDG